MRLVARERRERGITRFFPSGLVMRHSLMLRIRAGARAAATIGRLGTAITLGAALLATTLAIGCSWQNPTTTAPPSPPAAPGSPHVITDLSQLSSRETDAASLDNAAKVLKSDPSRDETAMIAQGGGPDTPSTLRRLFLDHPESSRYAETLIPHTQERLLNPKAAQYPGFSSMMLTQLLNEMVKEEKVDPIVKLELYEETKPVILTAVLDNKGQLKELIYQQHSGLAVVDDFVITACKASLWGNNMPKGAMSKDGNYRLRIEAQLSKYSADREGKQTFTTRIGLGIL
ncbi:MAG: hypothetical protein ACREPW_07235 [Candidatus Binataceae bacterium]